MSVSRNDLCKKKKYTLENVRRLEININQLVRYCRVNLLSRLHSIICASGPLQY